MRLILATILALLLTGCKAELEDLMPDNVQPWDNGVVHYRLDGGFYAGGFSEGDLEILTRSMKAWEKVANIQFIQIYQEQEYEYRIIRYNSETSSSTVGSNCTRRCYMFFGNNITDGTIIHELGHALGLLHEHQRPDRDSYIEILWDNIEEGRKHNFKIKDNELIEEELYPYDYKSVMHYKVYEFGGGSNTIRVFDETVYISADRVSEIDAQKMSDIYGEPITRR